MRRLKPLPGQPTLGDVIHAFPRVMVPIVRFQEALMRGPSPFSKAERELMAAYVSGLNSCSFCYRAHTLVAEEFGVDERLLEVLLDDIDAAPLDARMKPVLRYGHKFTTNPSRVVDADTEAILEAGWDVAAVFQATAVCACFNLINRLAQGIGFSASEEKMRAGAKAVADLGYAAANRIDDL